VSRSLVTLPHAALGFDCFQALTLLQYKQMRELGFVWRGGYLEALTNQEVDDASTADVAVVPIQEGRKVGWLPSSTTGGDDGARARRLAIGLSLPDRLDIWRDWESVAPSTTLVDLESDAKAWKAELAAGGFGVCVYEGAGLPKSVTPEWLYQLPFTGYAKSFSDVQRVAIRGYKWVQLYFRSADPRVPVGSCRVSDMFDVASPEVADVIIDAGIVQTDWRGGRVTAVRG